MQTITIAVVDASQEKRVELERVLQQDKDKHAIEVLTDATVATAGFKGIVERRLKSRSDLSFVENMVARIKRMKPRILLVNIQIQQLFDDFCNLLSALHRQCPDTLVVIIIDDKTIEKNLLLNALASGVRGFLDTNMLNTPGFSKMIKAVDQGEAWVSRQLLGEVMNKILFPYPMNTNEAYFDPAR